ncbi:thiamine pyrophosphate-dependent enzyme [Guggenheimella bovis]
MPTAVMTGNEAIARGFYEAGGEIAASYPGSPTVELLEAIERYPEIYSEFSTNEKVALEVAIGASMGGVRTIVSMKHVGVNIAMDPLMTFTQTVISGGFVLLSGDDPGMSSSQNEQDNRILGKFANMPILDPSNSQEAKDFTKLAFTLSETYSRPVMIRTTSRLNHSRSVVSLEDRVEVPYKAFDGVQEKYCMLPPYTITAQYRMKDKMKELQDKAKDLGINHFEDKGGDVLIITSGLMYEHVREVTEDISVFKLGLVYPIDIETIREVSKKFKKVIVVEEMMPFIENELKLEGIPCEGKKYFNFTGELDIPEVRKGLVEAGVLESSVEPVAPHETTLRGPLFCSGCPHRPIFDILKKLKATVIGDIGCYSMGLMYPMEVLRTNISMGASVGMIKGMRLAMDRHGDSDLPLVAVIGDGTFFHSGLPGFLNLKYKLTGEENITYIILDNSTTAMTGGQPTAESFQMDGKGQNIPIEEILRSFGYTDIESFDQFKYKSAQKKIQDAMGRKGVSILIATRPCALRYKVKEPVFSVDTDKCIGCRTCVRTNCPPLRMREVDGKLKSSIDPNQCVGCSICAQVCPVEAIGREGWSKKGVENDN